MIENDKEYEIAKEDLYKIKEAITFGEGLKTLPWHKVWVNARIAQLKSLMYDIEHDMKVYNCRKNINKSTK